MVCVQKLFLFQIFRRVCDFVGDLFPAFFAEQSVINGKCGVNRSGCFVAHDNVNGVDVAVDVSARTVRDVQRALADRRAGHTFDFIDFIRSPNGCFSVKQAVSRRYGKIVAALPPPNRSDRPDVLSVFCKLAKVKFPPMFAVIVSARALYPDAFISLPTV